MIGRPKLPALPFVTCPWCKKSFRPSRGQFDRILEGRRSFCSGKCRHKHAGWQRDRERYGRPSVVETMQVFKCLCGAKITFSMDGTRNHHGLCGLDLSL